METMEVKKETFELHLGEEFDELFQDFGEHVSMPTEPPPDEDRFIMSQGVKLEEKLWIDECYLFQDESLAPIFCKSKLIPLKTITTQKLELMQREQMEKIAAPEKEDNDTIIEEEEPEDAEHEQKPSTSEAKEADVWTADD